MTDTKWQSFSYSLFPFKLSVFCEEQQVLDNHLRAAFVRAMSLGANEHSYRCLTFDSIASAMPAKRGPKRQVAECVSKFCEKILANPPTFTGEEIRANIQNVILGLATELEKYADFALIREQCALAFKRGETIELSWASAFPESAKELRALDGYIARAVCSEISGTEYIAFQDGNMLRSACLYEAMKRCWPLTA